MGAVQRPERRQVRPRLAHEADPVEIGLQIHRRGYSALAGGAAAAWIRATICGLMLSAPFSIMCWTMRAPTAPRTSVVKASLFAFTQSIEAWRLSFRFWNAGKT